MPPVFFYVVNEGRKLYGSEVIASRYRCIAHYFSACSNLDRGRVVST